MEKATDAYKTLVAPSPEVLLKEKKSKFFGQAFPVQSEAEIKSVLEGLKTKHPQSNHICYAWQLGIEIPSYRVSDDGEPNNSAGMPIYGQIQSFEITNVLITVTRYFGGTKLGVGGLIAAYRNAAKIALEAATLATKRIEESLIVSFPYSEINGVMRIVKQKSITIVNQKIELECLLEIKVAKNDVPQIIKIFGSLRNVNILKN